MDWFTEDERSQSEGPSEDEIEALREHREQYGDSEDEVQRNTRNNRQRAEGSNNNRDNTNLDEDKGDFSDEAGAPIDLKSTFRELAPPKKKKVFTTANNSKMHGMFGKVKEDSNLKLQRKMMAQTYGSVKDLPTGADMNLSTLAQATRLGLAPYDFAQLGRSARIAAEQSAKVVRPAVAIGQVTKRGKLKRLDESLDDLLTGDVDLSTVNSIFETSHYAKAREWLHQLQQTPSWPPSTDPRFVGWLLQMYTECFGVLHVYGKAATALTALVSEIEDDDLKAKFHALLEIMVNGNSITKQHQPNLRSLKTAISYKSDPKAWDGFKFTLKKRADSYKLKTGEKTDALQQYSDLIMSPDIADRKLTENRKSYNHKKNKEREMNRLRKNSRDYDRNGRNRDSRRDQNQGKGDYQAPRFKDRRGQRDRRKFVQPENAVCFNCGAKGHKQSHCPTMKCQRCGKMGHSVTMCPLTKSTKNR